MPLPTVGGTLVKDINPATLALADGTLLTFANSGLSPVGASPLTIIRNNVFGAGKHAVEAAVGAGFSIPNPVTDDFTIYGVWRWPTARGNPTDTGWTGNASLFNNKSGATNTFGVTLRADGKVTAGIESMGGGLGGAQSVLSTAVIGADTHRIIIRRVKSSTLFKLYVDGALQGSFSYNSNTVNGSALDFFVGYTPWSVDGLLARWLAYDAAHSDADIATLDAYLASEYPPALVLRSTKENLYVASGPTPTRLAFHKGNLYLVEGATGDAVVSSKLVLYGVTGPDDRIRMTKGNIYIVTQSPSPGEGGGEYVPCSASDRPNSTAELCGTRGDALLEPCGTRPEQDTMYPCQPYPRH